MGTIQLSEIVYNPLIEETVSTRGWDKQTVAYALTHKSKIKTSIRNIARSMNKILQSVDIEDCYEDILYYLYRTEDYNIEKAIDRAQGGNDTIISLEAYIFSCVKYMTLRFTSKQIEREVSEVSDLFYSEENEELSLFDTIADKDNDKYMEKLEYDLESICNYYESSRYRLEVDIFQIWFIRLLTDKYNKKDAYNEILITLGINRDTILSVKKKSNKSSIMIDIAKAISVCGIDKAINTLRKYTYSADKIEKVVQLYEVGAEA